MPENDDELYAPDETTGPKTVRMTRENIDRLEGRAKLADQLAREIAFLKAGVKPDDPKLSYFVKGYDGDLTPDAIRAEAVNAGFLPAPEPSPEEKAAQESGHTAERVAAASTNIAPPPPSVLDREREYAEALATGGPQGLAAVAAKYGQVVGRNI
jgi:hypothetical protein